MSLITPSAGREGEWEYRDQEKGGAVHENIGKKEEGTVGKKKVTEKTVLAHLRRKHTPRHPR